MNTLLIYAAYNYTIMVTDRIIDTYIKDWPYLSGYGIALMLPEVYTKREGVAIGLISKAPNGGAIIKEVAQCQV